MTFKGVRIWSILTVLFVMNFLWNPLRLGRPGVFQNFQSGGELTVMHMMAKTKQNGFWSTGGFLLLDDKIYTTGFAIHGKTMSLLYRWFDVPAATIVTCGHVGMSFLLAALLAAFVLFAAREFGLAAGVALAVGCLLSDWMVFVGRNVYCIYPFQIMPCILSCILFSWAMRTRWLGFPGYAAIIGLVVLVKSLCYLDYSSNIVLSTAIGPIYYGMTTGQPWQRILRWSLTVLVASALAVILAIAATGIQAGLWLGSIKEGFGQLFDAAASRMYSSAQSERAARSGVSILEILGGAVLLPALSLPFSETRYYLPFLAFCVVLMTLSLLCLLNPTESAEVEAMRRRLTAWVVATWWGLGATLSWMVLMKGHMWHHAHMNGMLFYIPFMLMIYILTGLGVEFLCVYARKTRKVQG